MSPKELLRVEIKKLLKNACGEEFRCQGETAAALLCSCPLWSRYETLFLFLSMNSEIDTQPLLETALKDGKKVFAPGVQAQRLVFYPIMSAAGPWREGPFGIREPMEGPAPSDEWRPAKAGDFPALILAPGLAFDREGKRLGRGGGYYDRFFAELDEAGRQYTALGFCMDFQVVGQVPAGETDKILDGFLTGRELFIISYKKGENTKWDG